MKESYKKGDSDSILALSLAGGIARCRLKRGQGHLDTECLPVWKGESCAALHGIPTSDTTSSPEKPSNQ